MCGQIKVFGGDTVSRLGEKKLIARVCSALGKSCPPPPCGSGDDCALTPRSSLAKNIYTTVDSVVYGRHFDDSSPANLVGEKILKRNISDIASMGARPRSAVCAAVMSANVSVEWLDSFMKGLACAAERYGVQIIGGDIADAGIDNFFAMSLTLSGDSDLPPLLRLGARAGDVLYTTGALGFSFESSRHLTFEPRVEQGVWLARRNAECGCVSSCTDISDGIACDISNVLAADSKAVLDFVPMRSFGGRTSLEKALCDGEDYELLFSVRAACASEIKDFECAYAKKFGAPPIRIGRVEPRKCGEAPLWIKSPDGSLAPFSKGGFEHFA